MSGGTALVWLRYVSIREVRLLYPNETDTMFITPVDACGGIALVQRQRIYARGS